MTYAQDLFSSEELLEMAIDYLADARDDDSRRPVHDAVRNMTRRLILDGCTYRSSNAAAWDYIEEADDL